MTELTCIDAVKGVLVRKNPTVDEVLKAATPAAKPTLPNPTPIPRPTALSDDAYDAVNQIPADLEKLVLPKTRRQLSEEEVAEVVSTLIDLNEAINGLSGAKTQIKAALFNHFDLVAAEQGLITDTTPHTKEGWAVLPDTTSASVPNLPKKACRETRVGAATLAPEGLKALEDAGTLSHEDYLRMTTPIRVVNEDGVLQWLRDNPDKAEALAAVVTEGSSIASLHLRANH